MTYGHLMVVVVFVLLPKCNTWGDAFIRTEAMKASTIAEFFIENDHVRVKLEIGTRDFEAFRNVLPEEIYDRLGHPPHPLESRHRDFLQRDWILRVNGGLALPGHVIGVKTGRRILRNEITGSPVASQPANAEAVVRVEISYALRMPPETLLLVPPIDENGNPIASIGFVVYHQRLPINDFRYLSQPELLRLDWNDPWYSQFENQNLWRQFRSPIAAFLYVEPFEVRKEVVVRPVDLERWIDLGLAGKETIPIAEQESLARKVADFFAERCPVSIDGKVVAPIRQDAYFIRRTLRQTGPIDPPEDLGAIGATMGVIITYPTVCLPQKVTLHWELFDDRVDRIEGASVDEAGGLPTILTPDDPALVWINYLKNPRTGKLAEIALPLPSPRISIPLLSVLSLLIAGALITRQLRSRRSITLGIASVVVFGLVSFVLRGSVIWVFPVPWAATQRISPEDAHVVTHKLLGNIYRAFDFRSESDIYDTLAQSTVGETLERAYAEIFESLSAQKQSGKRVRVKEVELLGLELRAASTGIGFDAHCRWQVRGEVSHWGHTHERVNRCEAEIAIRVTEGRWRLTRIEGFGQERQE